MTEHSNIWVHGGHSYLHHHTRIIKLYLSFYLLCVPSTDLKLPETPMNALQCTHWSLLLLLLSYLKPTILPLPPPYSTWTHCSLGLRLSVLKSPSSFLWFPHYFCLSWLTSILGAHSFLRTYLKIKNFKHNRSQQVFILCIHFMGHIHKH